ncbi:MAG: hypothetical protein S4CHLAM37_16510 [Chlamydiia bacterium]|nr:hypothetical protein [Chlamydiia bacterium]
MTVASKKRESSKKLKNINVALSISTSLIMLFVIISQIVIAAAPNNWQKAKLKLHELIERGNIVGTEAFTDSVFDDVRKLSENNENLHFLSELQEKGFVIREGDDKEHRPVFVSLQGDFERTLAYALKKNKITHLVGMIHTPTPATPLCSEGSVTKDLVHASMEDEKRLYTVMKRPAIVREFLDHGGTLIAAYPKGGLQKRTKEQQKVYQGLLNKYPHNLVDKVLETSSMPWNMVGALYLFKTDRGGWGSFAIMARQANAPIDKQVWGMWFGPVSHPLIESRVEDVLQYLYEIGYFDFTDYLIK